MQLDASSAAEAAVPVPTAALKWRRRKLQQTASAASDVMAAAQALATERATAMKATAAAKADYAAATA